MDVNAMSLGEILTLARRMETDGIDFYRTASAKAGSDAGRLMFESLVRDEQRHLEALGRIVGEVLQDSHEEAPAGDPASRVKSVFEENRALLEERVAASPGDLEAIDIALGMEVRSFQVYEQGARTAADAGVRELMKRLAAEERQHHLMLENARAFLSDTGNWFIYEEHGIMDG